MCTVVVSWAPSHPLLVLALRDELVGRDFDDPGRWWPDQPSVVGGRDRQAGGTWCATDVAAGETSLVLNRPQLPVAAPGAASRGVLPLAALRHGAGWPDQVRAEGMAGFALVLATADALTLWEHDAAGLSVTALPPGTHLITSRGAEDGKADRHLAAFAAEPAAVRWRALVTGSTVADDPTSLLVRHRLDDGRTFATVFGQVFEVGAGHLPLSWSREPAAAASWVEQEWSP